jgi:hypothetical protein
MIQTNLILNDDHSLAGSLRQIGSFQRRAKVTTFLFDLNRDYWRHLYVSYSQYKNETSIHNTFLLEKHLK